MSVSDGRSRVVISRIEPEIDCGRYAIKRVVGEPVRVSADVFADGHDAIGCVLLYRKIGEAPALTRQEPGSVALAGAPENAAEWHEAPMEPLGNDRWQGEFPVSEVGFHHYTVQGWVDPFKSWRRDLVKRIDADADLPIDYLVGAELLEEATGRVVEGAGQLRTWAGTLRDKTAEVGEKRAIALNELLELWMNRYPNKRYASVYHRELPVWVDRERARYGAWYEFFPRSCAAEAGRHGTFRDAERMLDYVASMGFDVVYLPPIHPIGEQYRKGKNNSPVCEPGDVGSPWAIGGKEGGHKAIHPELGTIDDFRRLVEKARALGMELALDIAFQCSADHPYVKEHPEWFRKRPDGTVQYAENPPKKYQDIYPIDFETSAWQSLWDELKSVMLHWADEGVRIFRVDNPHTKAFRFWEWVIREVQAKYPETIFLSEAFTRPAVMHQLAKLGFSQSYTYFTWRNTKDELQEYFTTLANSGIREVFRPNLWPNTPDILPEYLQLGGRPASMVRLALAATLGASYGIYGPAFEHCEVEPSEPGGEEYLNSEKYELKHRDLDRPESLRYYIARVNEIRRSNPALHSDASLRFHATTNDQLICYSKRTPGHENVVLVVVNLDPHFRQSGFIELDLEELGVTADRAYQAHDLLTNARFLWQGPRNYIELDPNGTPVHIMAIRRRVRTEHQFDYYM